jgi:hypothetical protein
MIRHFEDNKEMKEIITILKVRTYPDKEFTMPMNFSNCAGKLDEIGGLVTGEN